MHQTVRLCTGLSTGNSGGRVIYRSTQRFHGQWRAEQVRIEIL
jgi:hypothetical protein